MTLGFTSELADLVMRSVRDLSIEVARLALAESLFQNGILPAKAGGTGVNNGSYTLTLTGNTTIGGSVPSGSGTTGRVAEWASSSSLQASTLAKTGAGVLTLSASASKTFTVGESVGVNGTAGKTLYIYETLGFNGTAGKTFYIYETVGLTGTPGATLDILGGGTLGNLAYSTSPLSPSDGGTGANNGSRTLVVSGNSGTLNFAVASKTLVINQTVGLDGVSGKTFSINNTLGLSGTDGSTLNIGSGGTLGSAAFTASSAYATASHVHAAGDVTSGTIATARLGSGSASSATLLHGNSTWGAVSLTADVSGTLPIANGGTGATSAGAALSNLGGISGSGTTNQLAYWSSSSAITGDSGLTYNTSTNALTAGSLTASSGGVATTTGFTYGSNTWTLGGFTAGGDVTSNGYVTITVNGTTRKLMTTA